MNPNLEKINKIPRHIIAKLQIIKDKEKIFTATKEKDRMERKKE